jgi:hypothetical protein
MVEFAPEAGLDRNCAERRFLGVSRTEIIDGIPPNLDPFNIMIQKFEEIRKGCNSRHYRPDGDE